jgi:hypothetical protein
LPASELEASGGGTVDGLAASPWNIRNQTSLDRTLLPSATVSRPPQRPPQPAPSRHFHPSAAAAADGAGLSRGAWFIVGGLVLIALVGSIAVYRRGQRRASNEPIAIPAALSSVDEPESPPQASSSPSAPARAAATAAASVRIFTRRKAFLDDPYADVPPAPARTFRSMP